MGPLKKAIMGGKFNIIRMCYWVLGGKVLGESGGNWGEKDIKRPYKALKDIL